MKRDLKSMVELKEFLKNPSPNLKVPVYTEKEGGVKPVNKSKDRITLRQVVDMIQRLDAKVDAGFNELRQDIKNINARIDRIDARLDYNGLKKLPIDR